jgi:hemerythrin-like domain-containing protein
MQDESTKRSRPGDPLRQLAQCHEKIGAHLAQLEAFAAADDAGLEERRAAVQSIVRWFETNGLRHRVDEDESLFPRLAAVAAGEPDVGAALRTLVGEHGAEDALVAELAAALGAGPDRGVAGLREAARCLVAHYRRHLEVEDRVVLPAAARALDAQTLQQVGEEMERRRTEGSCA